MAQDTESKSQRDQQHDQPIPGPKQVGPVYLWEPLKDLPMTYLGWIGNRWIETVRAPVHWLREKVLEYKGPKYYWYHKKFNRVLPIDECYHDDRACFYEANLEYRRNYLVDRQTLNILLSRYQNCTYWNIQNKGYRGGMVVEEECEPYRQKYLEEEINFYIKYGELKAFSSVIDAFTKQKYRMIMERRVKLANANKKPGEEEEISMPYTVS